MVYMLINFNTKEIYHIHHHRLYDKDFNNESSWTYDFFSFWNIFYKIIILTFILWRSFHDIYTILWVKNYLAFSLATSTSTCSSKYYISCFLSWELEQSPQANTTMVVIRNDITTKQSKKRALELEATMHTASPPPTAIKPLAMVAF